MNKKQLEKWREIYTVAMMIGEYDPWEVIGEETAFIYMPKDKERIFMFKIWGNKIGPCGISCYPTFNDYVTAHHLITNNNPKNEPAFYMQNAIYGFWDSEENVSEDNKRLLKKLGFDCDVDGSWLHFEMCEERRLPRTLTDSEAEAFADALGNLYMMLKAIFESRMPVDFKGGDAVIRKYAGNGTWHNTVMSWDILESELSTPTKVRDIAELKRIKKMPSKKYSLELDMRCLNTLCDDENGKVFFPFLITAVDAKTGYIYASRVVGYDVSMENGLCDTIGNICFDFGKPDSIATNDLEVAIRIEDFCNKANIKLKYQRKKLRYIEEALEDMFEHFGFGSEYDSNCSDEGAFYLSVSLMPGCYRHIKISAGATLEQLHEAILDAFEFVDDHAHVFFLNNKAWTGGGYYSKHIEDADKFSSDYILNQVLSDKQQFVYIFDFGEEWRFKCKVLKITDEICDEYEIIRSVGESPAQYPDYDEM